VLGMLILLWKVGILGIHRDPEFNQVGFCPIV